MPLLTVYITFAQADEREGWGGAYARHARRFELAGAGTCLLLPFDHVDRSLMERAGPDAVLMSGFARSFEDYSPSSLSGVSDWMRVTQIPILAICGSHQLAAAVFAAGYDPAEQLVDQPMRHLLDGEPVTNPDYHPEFFMERGFYSLDLMPEGEADPLFAGTARPPQVYESHYCEIKDLPPAFRLLASTPECRIQAMKHVKRLLYGTQFHPEDYSERFPDGRALLEAFFRMVRDAKG